MKRMNWLLFLTAFLAPLVQASFALAISHDNGDNKVVELKKVIAKNVTADYSGCEPRQVHLSFGNTTVDFNIVWVTVRKCHPCQVNYGIHPKRLQLVEPTTYVQFVELNSQGLPHYYLAKLENLSPGKVYYYRPTCQSTGSRLFRLHVPKLAENSSTEFLVYGDMGIQSKSIHSVVKEAQSGSYIAVIHVGDLAYDLEDDGGRVGDKFMDLIEPAASSVPYLTCPGNHEIAEGDFVHYRHRFAMPESHWPMHLDKLWYSIDIGLVHFVSYSTEVFFTSGGKYTESQRKWLIEDLQAAKSNKNQTPWIIAFGHRPMYCSSPKEDDCFQRYSFVRNGLESLFYQHYVDIVIQGHEHNYERLWPMFQHEITDLSYINVAAPIQIITGAAGNWEGTDSFSGFVGQPPWSVFRLDKKAFSSYGRLRIMNRTHIQWQQLSALSHDLIDQIWIIKDETVARNKTVHSNGSPPESYSPVSIIGIIVTCLVMLFMIYRPIQGIKRTLHNPYRFQRMEYITDC